MFSIFFNPAPVRDYATALQSDAKVFGRFFHACLAQASISRPARSKPVSSARPMKAAPSIAPAKCLTQAIREL